jgi:branched-chain amino acid transport system permease protein
MGIVSVAHGALFGIGAYSYAILSTQSHLPSVFSVAISGLLAAVLGYVLGFPSLRLKGDYLALATFGFSIVSYDLFDNIVLVTKGPMGITGIPNPLMPLTDKYSYLGLMVILNFLAVASVRKLVNSPWGRIIRTVRDREDVLPLCGKNPTRYKLNAFAFASFWTGVAGALYAGYGSYIHPSNFVPMTSIVILCMVIVGGMGSLKGSIAGALIFVALPELLRLLNISASAAGTINQLIFGLILVLFMILRPQGIFGRYRILNE